MNFELVQEPISVYREIFNGSSEQPIDLDVSLPDYCPDISRILKCQAVPQITSRNIVGDRLTTEGSTLIRIFYADENGSLRCCELSSAFSADFYLRTAPEAPSVFTDIQVNFMNCRAVTKRRVDIHCAFTIQARVWGVQQQTFLTAANGCGIRLKTVKVPACTHIATVQQPLSISEEFTLDHEHALPETILRFSADGTISDIKTIAGKIIAKGNLKINVLYETDALNGQTDSVSYTLPFSQVIDLNGMEEDCTCNVQLEILSAQVHLHELEGRGAAFEAEIHGALCATATKQRELTIITDAYSTDFALNTEQETITLYESTPPLEQQITVHGTLQDCTAARVLDIWTEPRGVVFSARNEATELNGHLCASLLLQEEDGNTVYRETLLDFSDRLASYDEAAEFYPQLQIGEVAYRLNNVGQPEIRAEVTVRSMVHIPHKYTLMKHLEPDLQCIKEKDVACAMTLYYAQRGESVWDIACRYNTTEEAICTENELTGDHIEESGMLFIPAV